ncbi:hypothetical protein VTJ49DRAFT_4192 [Mycothermus thermophilus]|uniref:Uncharacterized protein n=1 Tax=Humicola insolens TaxID=85995 RepID=A0ABR3V5X1_HUMIN
MEPQTVILTGPENWEAWDHEFRRFAAMKGVLDLIDPESPRFRRYTEQPKKPNIADYPKRLEGEPRTESTANGSEEELVDPINKAENVSELTKSGRELFNRDWDVYRANVNKYGCERYGRDVVAMWVINHVAMPLKASLSMDSYDAALWYRGLKIVIGEEARDLNRRAARARQRDMDVVTPLEGREARSRVPLTTLLTLGSSASLWVLIFSSLLDLLLVVAVA